MQNKVWVVAEIFRGQVVGGLLVFAKDAEEANQKAFDALCRIEKIRVQNNEMKLVVEEITDFDQVFSFGSYLWKGKMVGW